MVVHLTFSVMVNKLGVLFGAVRAGLTFTRKEARRGGDQRAGAVGAKALRWQDWRVVDTGIMCGNM